MLSFLLSSRPRLIALLSVAVLLLGVGIYEMTPGQRLRARQEALLEWAREGAPGEFVRKFAAADYHDQWEQSAAEVAERVRAARLFHPNLEIDAAKPEFIHSGDTATVSQEITIRPGDGQVVQHEFQFTWHRENFWPWSWKLRAVKAEGLRFQ